MPTRNFEKVQGNEYIEICVEYTITPITPATMMDPEEGGEVEILEAWIEPSGESYKPNEQEAGNWSIDIFENHVFEPSDDRI